MAILSHMSETIMQERARRSENQERESQEREPGASQEEREWTLAMATRKDNLPMPEKKKTF